ncbi:hypothetical protein G6F25_013157 [Rhizopus arrhizus]|nr:hypothetical protein G6F25_013157 [Rhizopus arrhizus]
MRKQKDTLSKHSSSQQVSNTWKTNLVVKKMPLVSSSFNNTTKQPINNEFFKQQQEEITIEEVIQTSGTQAGVAVAEAVEKTFMEDEDVGTQPPTTNTSPTTTNHSNKQLILLRQATSIKNNKHDFVISLNNKFYSTPPSTINYIIHTKLRDSSRWNRPRGPSSTFYQFLEDDHSTPMATIGDSRWVQDTICETTNSLETPSTNTICRRPIASQHSCPKIFDRGNDRSFTDSKQELPFKFLYIEGTDEASANFRLPKTQQFHPSRAFQNGRGAGTARTHRKRRLHLQNRFKRCIRSHTYTPRFSRLSKLRKPRKAIV